jgi:hypothetical protein
MGNEKLELIISYSQYAKEKESVALLALGRSRRIIHCCSGEFFSIAYDYYDESVPEPLVDLKLWHDVCSEFTSTFSISYKEDFSYLIRHPEFTEEPDHYPMKNALRMKFDYEEPKQRAAYDYLRGILPKNRIIPIEKIMKHYLVLTENEFFIRQSVLRLMRYLQDMNRNEKELSDETKRIIDMIWDISSTK